MYIEHTRSHPSCLSAGLDIGVYGRFDIGNECDVTVKLYVCLQSLKFESSRNFRSLVWFTAVVK